jgi:hypothetical protein
VTGSIANSGNQRLGRVAIVHLFHLLLHFFHLPFHVFDFDAVFADIEPQVGVNAHVLIGNPDQREEGDEVAAPVVKQQFVTRDDQKERRHIVTKAEFAGKQEEKLAARRIGVDLTLANTICARLAEDLFMRHGPGDAGDRERKRKKPHELQGERHSVKE